MISKPHTEIEGLRPAGADLPPRVATKPPGCWPFTQTAGAMFGQPSPAPSWWLAAKGR